MNGRVRFGKPSDQHLASILSPWLTSWERLPCGQGGERLVTDSRRGLP